MIAAGGEPMPHFFFNIRTENGLTKDEEGQVLPDLEAARDEALKTVRELHGDLASAVAQASMLIEITDETGEILSTLPLPAGKENADDEETDAFQGNDLA